MDNKQIQKTKTKENVLIFLGVLLVMAFMILKLSHNQKWDDYKELEPEDWCDKYGCSDFMVNYLKELKNVK